ncbi:YqeG family HAD IIIA-type phosphatase [Peribacillus asahii]|uniref:YqeG family HAD IIIA-type phosphatase n=1 Tax=Peribacillus asahii TaxID=228899 RepID=UPI00207A6367|nr:YqeG family HAD IIIA-type phosphatase [Peribacillus asahii]USK58878.1 YqeG family HAD IIIA-type phosphatase [Peribacillus asahii]
MLKLFLPSEQIKSIFDITPEDLKKRGIKGIITDLDNTLVEWDRPNATRKLMEWFDQMREHGILVTIVSNNNEQRVRAFSDPLRIPFIYRAKKPLTTAFKKACVQMGLKREETVVVGDQLLTDVFGGNRGGFHTILVIPVSQSDGINTKINRFFERKIMSALKRKGMIEWEERN